MAAGWFGDLGAGEFTGDVPTGAAEGQGRDSVSATEKQHTRE